MALTSLPSRWVGADPQRIADDLANALDHLVIRVDFVGVQIRAHGGARILEAVVARCDEVPSAWHRRNLGHPPVEGAGEVVVPIGSLGKHGFLVLAGTPGIDLQAERLLAVVAANQAEVSLRTLDLEREVIAIHEKLAALEKLSALGQLVGGVAHEIRTPLAYASNNLWLMERLLARNLEAEILEKTSPHVEEMGRALDRINAIVLQLRRFAKHETTARLHEDLRGLVMEALRLWRATHAGQTRIEERLSPTPPVRADRVQLQQVVLNLVENAADATGPTGRILVRTLERNSRAVILVEDDGIGMSPEVQDRLFQPFHTTKPTGLGLGLSIVRRIVEVHGGAISVASRPGHGTRIEVTLPRAATGASLENAAPVASGR